jgi:hypothetical protein
VRVLGGSIGRRLRASSRARVAEEVRDAEVRALGDVVLVGGRAEALSLDGCERNEVSTSTHGMYAPTRT